MPNIYRFNIGSDFIRKASSAITDFIANHPGKIRIALSGGSSPKAVYEKLSQNEYIDWNRIELYEVDERYVPEGSAESNARMIRESLSDKAHLNAFDTSREIADALNVYEQKLQKLNRPYFDLVLLGLGADGHTASLFPRGPELEEVERLVVHSKSPKGVTDRLSLSFPAIMSSKKIIFLIRGADKQEVFEDLLDEDIHENDIPAKVILDHDDVDIYYDYS